uniref:Uncharacterized protein n=1 Tax=Kalanchoe fedtschenkoi TaxID=63787 RepID=A0A7N0VIA4_KALFE
MMRAHESGGGWLYRIDENRCAVLYWGSGSLISGLCSLELQTVIQFRRGRRMKRPVCIVLWIIEFDRIRMDLRASLSFQMC